MNKSLYDLDTIRALPILDVCEMLGINVEVRGKNHWCKVRPERMASVILHSDSNKFYDFGNQKKGSVIDLVQYASGCDVGAAIERLADYFGIEPCSSMEDYRNKPLSNWEYQQINLYGDLASKNIIFPVESSTLNELGEISYAYGMSMNTLREMNKDAYEEIILSKAFPYVEQLRNNYYREVWNYYDLVSTFGSGSLFFESTRTQEKFKEQTRKLERAERILFKACCNTSIEVSEPQSYEPMRVLSHIMQGRLVFELGSVSSHMINAEAEAASSGVCTVNVSYDDFHRIDFGDSIYSAVFNGKNVLVSYLERDKEQLLSLLRPYIIIEKEPLNKQIFLAEARVKSDNRQNKSKETIQL